MQIIIIINILCLFNFLIWCNKYFWIELKKERVSGIVNTSSRFETGMTTTALLVN